MPTYIDQPIGFKRLDPSPLDSSSVFTTTANLTSYALNEASAFAGQICTETNTGKAFVIQQNKSVKPLVSGDNSITSIVQVTQSQYDALVSGNTVDDTTMYVIVN
jgi:hypothetical protein